MDDGGNTRGNNAAVTDHVAKTATLVRTQVGGGRFAFAMAEALEQHSNDRGAFEAALRFGAADLPAAVDEVVAQGGRVFGAIDMAERDAPEGREGLIRLAASILRGET